MIDEKKKKKIWRYEMCVGKVGTLHVNYTKESVCLDRYFGFLVVLDSTGT